MREVISNQAKGILVFIACAVLQFAIVCTDGGTHLDIISVYIVKETFFPGFINYTV